MWLISYWVFPVIASGMWLATILTLLIVWSADGYPIYSSMEPGQTIAYISDVAAHGLKPLFITGCAITGVFFDLGFVSERWLRHNGRLLRNKGRLDKGLSTLAIIFSICGAVGLILLSIFDTLRYRHQHNGFLVLFMGGYLLSAVFVCLEYLRLGIHYREHRILTISFWIKLIFIIVELALAIAFGVTGRGRGRKNQAAVIEWVIAFIFTFYVFSFVIDLAPAVRTRRHIPQGQRFPEMVSVSYPAGQQDQLDIAYEQPLTTDSMGDMANRHRGFVINDGGPSNWPEDQRNMPYNQGRFQEQIPVNT
ncbi:hypothetical protein CPC735_000880 [Coccidioides posadasii C735 delta SOWgp]|uniref:CWH43-like N-terminal domain-containing protein n=1 Tax=Coccidioides posadasii (strain C735) TaxID=222929 RepID=C5PEB6_COCP7|nr:hypothetical protein CPC735_000880 [Coccidioides posadasii C735 delta SOWgp]EER24744.1 hypothetical protein CPC735_000880 [Coccidioides posadasii C735 delta SOWgp]|eukprot:XP_003066889.1 hypothetical protein CPC735_000880 [Coccidioides posadasii C735 delta SOWgp]